MTPGAAIPYGLRSSYLYDDANYATVADGNLQLIARRQPASASASCEYKRRNRESQRLHPAVRAVRGARQAARRSRVLARVRASQRHTYNDEIDVLEADWGRGSQRCRLRHSPRAGGRAPPDVLPSARTTRTPSTPMRWSGKRGASRSSTTTSSARTSRGCPYPEPESCRPRLTSPTTFCSTWPSSRCGLRTPRRRFPAMMVDYVRAWR